MFKALPAVEKEFDMNKVGQSYPTWVRVVMIIFVMAIFFGAILADWAHAADKVYIINPEVEVLGFLGDPGSLDVIPMKFVTAEKQLARLLHKRSGPGLYAFHIYGLVVKSGSGIPYAVASDGFFVIHRKHVKLHKR